MHILTHQPILATKSFCAFRTTSLLAKTKRSEILQIRKVPVYV